MVLKNDFDPKKEISDLAASINQPEKVAENWCKAATSQIVVEETIEKIFLKQMSNSEEIKTKFKNWVRESAKENIWIKWNGICIFFSGIAATVIAGVILFLLTKSLA